MSHKSMFIAFAIVVVVVVAVAALVFTNILGPSAQRTALSDANSTSSLFTTAQSLYNSSGSFNNSYAFFVNLSFINSSASNNLFLNYKSINGEFQVARYGDSLRASLAYSMPYPYDLFNASILLNTNLVDIYNGSHITFCSKQSFINESPVSTTIESIIVAQDQKPMTCNSTARLLSSFKIANSFTMVPFNMINNPQSSDFNSFNGGGNVTFLGYKTYLGQSCSMEKLTPPPNATGSAGMSFEDCVSSTNGLPLYLLISVNGSVFISNNISAVNAAPTSAGAVTALPSGAVLG